MNLSYLFFLIIFLSVRCSGDEYHLPVFGVDSKPSDIKSLAFLKKKDVVIQLVGKLHVVNVSTIPNPVPLTLSDDMDVIWALRGLRYLTKKDFYDCSLDGVKAESEESKSFLINDNNCTKFFGVWMSRDVIYVSQEKSQLLIIEQWKRWVLNNLDRLPVEVANDINDWYF